MNESNVNTNVEYRLTTTDNPFDPFDDFTSWYMFDEMAGYCCSELVADHARLTDSMSQYERTAEINRAIDEIVLNDVRNIFLRVRRTLDDTGQTLNLRS